MDNNEKPKDKQELTLLAEINTIKFPITTLNRKHQGKIKIHWKSPDGSRELLWELSGPRLPGPFALRIQRYLDAYMRELVKQGKLTIDNRRFEYSIYDIAKTFNLSIGKHTYEIIKKNIHDLIFMRINTTQTLWDFANKKFYESLEPIGIYERGAFVGDIVNEIKIEKSFIEVSEWYLRNIIAGFTKPLLPFYMDLSPTAARLYEILSLHVSDSKNIIDTKKIFSETVRDYVVVRHISLSYSWLCERMPISPQRNKYHALRKLEKAHEELIKYGYIYEFELDDDWQLHYWLGDLADEEIKKRQKYLSEPKRQGREKPKGVEAEKRSKIEQTESSKTVVIEYRSNAAGEVKIAGDFNSWQAEKMIKISGDLWQKFITLEPGKYKYKLIIDGCWITNPFDKLANDEYGNNLIEI